MKNSIIVVHQKDNFYTVYQKVSDAYKKNDRKIVLMVPKKSAFFADLFHVSILVSHFSAVRFSVVTKDKEIGKYCRRMGIQCVANIRDLGSTDLSFGQEVLKENFSFFQFLSWIIRRYIIQTSTAWQASYQRSRDYIVRTKSSIMALFIFWICIACLLLGSIIFFTLPKTTIVIEPAVFIKPVQVNVVFLEKELIAGVHDYEVPVERYTYSIGFEDTFVVKNYDTTNAQPARGTIRVYNFSGEPFRLRPGTRFETEEGLVYTADDWVVLPGGSPSEAYADIKVTAQYYDIHSIYMWERWNILTGVTMTVPGLEWTELFDDIRAETITDLTWGDNNILAVFSDEQYESLLDQFSERITLEAERDILHSLDEIGEGKYVLPIHGITRPIDMKISTSHNPGDITSEVTFVGVGEFETVVFDLSEVHKHIIHVSSGHLLEDLQQLVSTPKGMIDIVHVFSQETDPYQIKATVQADVAYKYQLHSDKMRQMFTDNFLTEILGKHKDEAKRALLNNTMIADVDIRITPFWKDTLSMSPSDIVFKISD